MVLTLEKLYGVNLRKCAQEREMKGQLSYRGFDAAPYGLHLAL